MTSEASLTFSSSSRWNRSTWMAWTIYRNSNIDSENSTLQMATNSAHQVIQLRVGQTYRLL